MKLSVPPTWEELKASIAVYAALPKPYSVEKWYMNNHGDKDCDAQEFTTLAQAWKYYNQGNGYYGRSIFFTGEDGVRLKIQSSEAD